MASKILINCIKLDKKTYDNIKDRIKAICSRFKKQKNNTTGTKFDFKNTASVTSICILDAYRGTGAADNLLKEYELLLSDMNVNKVVLHVIDTNTRARTFYEKNGFEIWYLLEGKAAYIKNLQKVENRV